MEPSFAPHFLGSQVVGLPAGAFARGFEEESDGVGVLVLDGGLVQGLLEAGPPPGLGSALLPVEVGDPVLGVGSSVVAVAGEVDDPVDLLEVELEGGHVTRLVAGGI